MLVTGRGLCLSESVVPLYPVSMTGEIKDPTPESGSHCPQSKTVLQFKGEYRWTFHRLISMY